MSYQKKYKNLNDMFQKKVEENPNALALRTKKNKIWEEITREEYLEFVKNIGMALKEFGISKNDKVAILSNTRIEWVYADMGILGIGAITVSLYQSAIIEEVEHILKDSDSSFLFVEDNSQLDKIISVKNNLTNLKKVVLFSGESKLDWAISFEEFLEFGKKYSLEEFKNMGKDLDELETAAIIYTSGTTGYPKGAVLSHLAFLSSVQAISNGLVDLKDGCETFLFLPLAHVFAKMIYILSIHQGMSIAFFESMEKLLDSIGETNPDFIGSVPRIYEKIYTRIIANVEKGGVKAKLFYWALDVGKKVSTLKLGNKKIPKSLKIKYTLANKLVFSKIKEKFGKNFKFFVSGGAPLAREIAEFFHAIGVIIIEGYGLTETAGVIVYNPMNAMKFGTVGKAFDFAEIKLAEDGEILCKGPVVMKGYYNNPEETKEVLKDGWFYTGDIGEFDEDGYLKITDRKKDIIVTAAGKNIAPQHIENISKTSRYISQIIALGDKKKYLVALLNLDYNELIKYAIDRNISFNKKEDLIKNELIYELIEKEMNLINEQLPSYATIKYFKIIEKEFSIETGELTPSLKIKRKFCMEKYKDLIDEMY